MRRDESVGDGLDTLESWLEPFTPRRIPWILRLLGFLLVPAILGVVLAAVAALTVGAASSSAVRTARDALQVRAPLVEPPLPGRTEVRDREGNLMATLYTYDRTPVGAEDISENIFKAVVATEDVRYFEHVGVDWQGMARALVSNASGNAIQGGSSITQQYVKNARALNALLEGDVDEAIAATSRTPYRKLEEVRLALDIERKLSKEDILVRYLNIAYFGRGAYGVESAARRYFSVPARELTVPQAALLAGMLQAPDLYDPVRRPGKALERRNTVLDRMQAAGYLSEREAARLALTGLGLRTSSVRQGCTDPMNGLYCDAVRRALLNEPLLGDTEADRKLALLKGGLTIYTNLDPTAQEEATRAAQATVPAGHRVAVGIAVVEPGSGEVRALASNRTFGVERGQTQLPLLTSRSFQPASTFKPFTLAAALEQGWDTDRVLPGGATYRSEKFFNPEGGRYHNVEGMTGTNVTIPEATRLSLNTAYIQLAEEVGIPAVADVARRLGVQVPDTLGPRDGTFILGSYEVSVLEMAAAYAAFAADGLYCKPRLVSRIEGLPQDSTYEPEPCQQVLSPAVARAVTATLSRVVEEGTATRARIPGRPSAGKTGTSASNGAAWFVGYTPQLVAAVWMGDPRGGPTHPLVNTLGYDLIYGGTLATVIWKDLMESLLAPLPREPLPTFSKAYLLDPAPPSGDIVVPRVVGLSAKDADALLRSQGLKVELESQAQAEDHIIPGVVVDVSPSAGQTVPKGSTVTIRVSS